MFFATNKAQKKTAAAALDDQKKTAAATTTPAAGNKHAYIIGISILSRFQMKAKNEVTGANRIQDHRKMIARILDTIYILICTIYILIWHINMASSIY